jgi:hypothetical protein
MGTTIRRVALLLLAMGLMASGKVAFDRSTATASPERPACEASWSTLPKSHLVSMYTTATVVGIQAGATDCFDRLVVELGPRHVGLPGPQGEGYQARYVPPAESSGTRDSLTIEGGALLAIAVNAAAHDDHYEPTYEPRDPRHAVDVTGFRTFRQVVFVGTFEAQTEIVVGVQSELPFRAFVVSGPDMRSQLIVDVAHQG